MNRCLHITIHENPGAARRRATTFFPGASNADPGSGYTVPLPDDPGSGYTIPVPDDPGSGYTVPVPDDPGSGYTVSLPDDPRYVFTPSSGSGGCEAVVATCSCCCAAPACSCPPAGTTTAALPPGVRPSDYSGFVIVRLAAGVVGDSPESDLWNLADKKTPKLEGLKAVLELRLGAPSETAGTAQRPVSDPAAQAISNAVAPAEPLHLVSRPLIELLKTSPIPVKEPQTWSRGECLALIKAMERTAASTPFAPLHSLTDYWRLDLRDHPDLTERVVEQLNSLAEVDLAYRELAATDPGAGGKTLAEDQGYLDDAPAGISAAWAWKSLGLPGSQTGTSSTQTSRQRTVSPGTLNPGTLSSGTSLPPPPVVCDLEQGWNRHNDLTFFTPTTLLVYGANRADEGGSTGQHGTAVLGQLAAVGGATSIAVKGAAADVATFSLTSHYRSKNVQTDPFPGTSGHVAVAIVQALSKPAGPLKEGDILLLEVQRGLLPAETDEADFDAIRLASALKVIVVEAAGNGGFDLDRYIDPDTKRTLRRGDPGFRDSGAILVGAARAAVPHDRAPFSNYGSRLDCFGWGEAVTTTGFGDLSGTTNQDYYTNTFNGTSSASPIIAGAAALVQALYQKQPGSPPPRLGPQEMRSILSDPATGTRQGPNVAGFIGIMPDLRAIVRGRLQLVPDVYLRRSIGDDGSAPGPADEISSSPDILVWNTTGDPNLAFGETSAKVNFPAAGDPAISAQKLYVRLRNRGLGLGAVRVQLFASPAATLIAPERWIPAGNALDVDATLQGVVPPGDTLFLAGPVAWTPPSQLTAEWWSFLAILTPPESGFVQPPFVNWGLGLPPSGPYFDWTEYRAFLRRHGVAWRNTHRVPTPVAGQTLKFLIAGTPDQTRHFDLEVIQRLPAGMTVTLDLPTAPALAAKLRQNQPWLGVPGTSMTSIALPPRPRITFKRVALPAGTAAEAAFTLSGTPLPTSGHSLALRQLWKGEEVGRITWFFGPA
jgi:hypothetical protein